MTIMPSSMTHGYFSMDVYDKIDNNIKMKLKNYKRYLKIFGQGPDPYFFFDFHLTKRSKDIYIINRDMQHSNVNKHFVKLINYINEKEFYDNGQVMAYLYGQICHFVLDSTAHPYIIYNTGMYYEDKVDTYKYNGLHEEMEYYIDSYFIYEREKVLPKDFKAYKHLFDIGNFNSELKKCIDDVVLDVYGYDNASSIYYKSICDMKKFYYIFNYDKYGIKKFVYRIMDKVCMNKCVRKEELSFNIDPLSKLEYLNNDKKVWSHPCDINEKYDFSFKELYDTSTWKAVKIINTVDKMLKERKTDNKKIEDLFKNLDYGTGKDCNLNLEYKYFKF